jgi:hypothetical protein
MIVLDEQLLGRQVELDIGRWYRGQVVYIHALRPNTVVQDDAIPGILRAQPQPTFVTINETDFWLRMRADRQFCLVCIAVPDSRVPALAGLLQQTLQHPEFRTKAQRMGHVLRVTTSTIHYYAFPSTTIYTLDHE